MIDERKIETVAKNFSADSWDKYEKTLEKMIRSAYIEGFKEGVRKGIETCNRCEGKDENFEHGADVCKSCRRGVVDNAKTY
jgi:uncharacterized protein YnzC (UPF0291/DUF896 family)